MNEVTVNSSSKLIFVATNRDKEEYHGISQ